MVFVLKSYLGVASKEFVRQRSVYGVFGNMGPIGEEKTPEEQEQFVGKQCSFSLRCWFSLCFGVFLGFFEMSKCVRRPEVYRSCQSNCNTTKTDDPKPCECDACSSNRK